MKTSNEKELAVIIPVFNEAKNLYQIIEDLSKTGVFIIVVDDGSSDESAAICKKFSNLMVLKHHTNLGYVKALNTGFDFVSTRSFKYVATFDADGQLQSKDLIRLLNKAKIEKSDLMVGYRNFKNRYSESLFASITKYYFSLNDPFCGLKLYKLDSIRNLLPFDSYNLIGAELLFRSHRNRLKIDQMPISVKRRSGVSRFGNSLNGEIIILIASIKIIFRFIRILR
tara:strand:+ start:441 stop:1118 length:678 start_codon:yes stop_codon:yes gene_type:complete